MSRTTVSNAYNRPDQLSAPLRARVLEAARRLGYPGPDPVARSLRTRKAGAVGTAAHRGAVLRLPGSGGHRFPRGSGAGLRAGRTGAAAGTGEPGARRRGRGAPGQRRRLRRVLGARRRPALQGRAGTAAAHRRVRPADRGRGCGPGRGGRPGRHGGAHPLRDRPRTPPGRRAVHAPGRRPVRRAGVRGPAGRGHLPGAARPAGRGARRAGRGGRGLGRRAGVRALRPQRGLAGRPPRPRCSPRTRT